tara:strand:+ start:9960 stop:10157 length:198 start_codon:yes stop_codon:yes gene_type:complete
MLSRSTRTEKTQRVRAITFLAETAGEEIFFTDLEAQLRSSVKNVVLTVQAGQAVSRLTLEVRDNE